MFTKEQKNILNTSGIKLNNLTEEDVFKITRKITGVDSLSDNQLVEFLEIANAIYRGGFQFITDADYDSIYILELKNRHPKHSFLEIVEPLVSVGVTKSPSNIVSIGIKHKRTHSI